MFEFRAPESRAELCEALLLQQQEIASFVTRFAEDVFFAPQGERWSPAGHLRHLIKSVRAVANGLEQPRLALLVFGRSKRGSRSLDEIVEIYRAALEAGGQAGRFGPSHRVPELTPGEWRDRIMAGWASAGQELREATLRWSEKQLDVFRLPHPLIGKLTLREMLLWTLHHNAHHARRIAERSE